MTPAREAKAELAARLAAGRRNQTDDLPALVLAVGVDRGAISTLIDCAGSPEARVAARAVWVLRRVVERDPGASRRLRARLLGELTRSPHWEVRAELCHILPRLGLGGADAKRALAFFRANLKSESRIVSAWSLDGLEQLSRNETELHSSVLRLVRSAREHTFPAVRARARRILARLERESRGPRPRRGWSGE